MIDKLQELRKKLQEKETRQNMFQGDNALYPFWNIPYSTETELNPAVIRFLPDLNEENPFFWVEIQKIKLSFSGVKGQDEDKEVYVQVPCMEMWEGGKCPILKEIRPWFKLDKEQENLARKYWKKRSYIFQGFVRVNPLDEQDTPENPIRRFSINSKLYQKIKAGLMDTDMDEMPNDFEAGTDFKILRTKQTTEIGTFANYDTSGYGRKSSALTKDELEAIEIHGLKNLNDFIPKKPDEEVIALIKEMFEASVNGELYDLERWGKNYRPAGLKIEASEVVETTGADTKESTDNTKKSTKQSTSDILAAVKERAAANS